MLRVSQHVIDGRLGAEANLRRVSFGWVWLAAFSFSIGILAFWSTEAWILAYFVPAAYVTILYSLVKSIQTWRDPLNPLCVILLVGFVRFFLPGILLLIGAQLPYEVDALFSQMGLSKTDWEWGHALALLGILGVVMGWLLFQEEAGEARRYCLYFHLPPGIQSAALGGMIVGGIALGLFFFSNASFEAITSGTFRETEIQEGTGKYFYMTYLLIGGSVLLSCYYQAKHRTGASLFPVLMATMLYWILGGRVRALLSLAAGLILLWYFSAERRGWQRLPIRRLHLILAVPLITLGATWISLVGSLYRGGAGTFAVVEALSLRKLWDYVQSGIFTDFGQLHSLAGAISIGPGILNGPLFLGVLTWPLSEFLPLTGRSAGVFIAETLIGFSNDRKWGLNASLIGDAYLNSGLVMVLLVMILFGVLLKMLYLRFRQGKVHGAIYAIALISSLQLCFLSIETWPQVVTTVAFMFAIIFAGKTLFRLR
jgi:oligosaccharide repeat unit polymerase